MFLKRLDDLSVGGKGYLVKESLDRLWSYHYEGSMLRYLKSWIDQLRWSGLNPWRSWPTRSSTISIAS